MSYHTRKKHSDTSHPVGGCHTFMTDGPGCWMDVPETKQQPKEQQPPTEASPVRMHHKMAQPYSGDK
jgi:hypothetical protein